MTIDQATSDHESSNVIPRANQNLASDPNTASLSSIEVWLRQTASVYSGSPSSSQKRKRSSSRSSQPHPPSPPHLLLTESPRIKMGLPKPGSPNAFTPPRSTESITSSLKQTPSAIVLNEMPLTIPTDPHWVKGRLRSYKCYQDEPNVLERYPAFHKRVLAIVNGKRESNVGPGSAQKFREVLQVIKDANEDTFLHNILPMIAKTTRTVKRRKLQQSPAAIEAAHGLQELQANNALRPDEDTQEGDTGDQVEEDNSQQVDEVSSENTGEEEEPEETIEETEWVVEDFFQSGVLAQKGPDFRRTLLPQKPGPPEQDRLLAKAMEKYDGMSNPKPDYIYGTLLRKYSVPDDIEISMITEFLLEVVPLVNFPWFLIEGKSYKGSRAEAENQVCRGGAVLVNAHRLLLRHIGEAESVKGSAADDCTFVFSAALCPSVMEFRVHWAEVHEKKNTIFHMHRVASENLGDPTAAAKLRRIIHNILDWGCGHRFEGIKKTWDKIYDFERKRVAADNVSESGEGGTRGPKKRKKGPSK